MQAWTSCPHCRQGAFIHRKLESCNFFSCSIPVLVGACRVKTTYLQTASTAGSLARIALTWVAVFCAATRRAKTSERATKPREALDCFLRTKMDVLVLGEWVVPTFGLPPPLRVVPTFGLPPWGTKARFIARCVIGCAAMFSERFGKSIVITDHARGRMAARAISEVLLRDMIETGEVAQGRGTDLDCQALWGPRR